MRNVYRELVQAQDQAWGESVAMKIWGGCVCGREHAPWWRTTAPPSHKDRMAP